MTLLQEATLAEKISDALSEFRRRCPPSMTQDINAAQSRMSGLAWALHEIHRLLDCDSRMLRHIEADLKFVHLCIVDTLDDIWTIMGRIGNCSTMLFEDDFQRTWQEIATYCYRMGGATLATRIDLYQRFVLVLCQILSRQRPAHDEFLALRQDLRRLGAAYDRSLIHDKRTGEHDAELRPTRRISYERERRPAPEEPPPLSPISSPTTPSTASQMSSIDGEIREHWAKAVFADMSSTRLPLTQEPSRYHQDKDHPASDNPDDKYDQVLVMSFLPDVRVSLHCRPENMKSRMMLGLPAPRGRRLYTSLSLEKLKLRRSGCMLRFYHTSRDGRSNIPWVSLQFSTIERLVLFACTFIAMRCQSGTPPKDPFTIWDDQYRDELEEYRGRIFHGHQHLSLFIYYDRQSGAIRLQATKGTGTRAGTPVWTAFVTNMITSPRWCEPLDRTVVLLNELQPKIFRFKHEMDRAPSGAHVLEFEVPSDATAFLMAVDKLRVAQLNAPI